MERLTSCNKELEREMICRHEDCDTSETYCPHLNEANCPCLREVLNKLAHYEDLEEQGLLREVKKGKWIRVNVQKSWGKSTKIVCSICEKKSWLNYDFCPNCGADMREEYQNAND